ncbi:hypothetical protein [Aurantiacibacter sp. MUD61]|uniref:hypothetical protein n=1 Tax=Aurantiacibacter sp. MUD61 TaxID=3009083 RepID=UPI0022F0B68B|nr:hypothetical protein [Aurantiacibacter sp. MUD61]
MKITRLAITTTLAIVIAASAATAQSGNGRGNGGGSGGGGNEEPPSAFVPAIAYFDQGRKYKDIRIANVAGDQACLVLRTGDGQRNLRGFDFDAANNRLAYSIDETGIFVTTWEDADGPCNVASAGNVTDPASRVRVLGAGDYPEVLDWSPDGRFLLWTEPDQEYTGLGSSTHVMIYDTVTEQVSLLPLESWGGTRLAWGVDGDWGVGGIRFSPDFATTNEVVFVGASLDGSRGEYNSLFAFDIAGTSAPRLLYDGASTTFDLFINVTNPQGAAPSRVVFENVDRGELVQLPLVNGNTTRWTGGEAEYSCDNARLVHQVAGRRGRASTYITSADGSGSTLFSSDGLRWLDWLCP